MPTFINHIHLRGRDLYVLWTSDLRLDGDSSLVRDDHGQVLRFSSEEEAGAFQRYGNTSEPVEIGQLYDLDAIERWCVAPDQATLDCGALLDAWRLLAGFGLIPMPVALPHEPEAELSQLIDKLMLCWARGTTNAGNLLTHYDLHAIASLLAHAIARLEVGQ